ncbi:putative ribonuclease H-like domain-containing protein, partial [Tanacetum coccineum]
QEKEGMDFKIAKFDDASKCLDKMLESQITDKSKKGIGYHVVALPYPLSLNAPTKLDLSYSGLDEFKEPEFNEYGPRDTVLKSTIDSDKESKNSKENTDDSLEKEQVSDNENSSIKSSPSVVKETIFHAAKKVNCPNHQKKRRVTWNNYNKVDHDYYSKTSHPSPHRNMTPKAVLLKTGLKQLSTARPIYTAQSKPTVQSARPMTYFSKYAQSTIQRPFYKKTALTNRTEFKNKVMDDFFREKGIRKEYSVARTPQQNGVAERRNRTLIKAARTMLADSKLPTTF